EVPFRGKIANAASAPNRDPCHRPQGEAGLRDSRQVKKDRPLSNTTSSIHGCDFVAGLAQSRYDTGRNVCQSIQRWRKLPNRNDVKVLAFVHRRELSAIVRRLLLICAGSPNAITSAGMSLKTVLRAPTTAPLAIFTPGATNTSLAIQTWSPI